MTKPEANPSFAIGTKEPNGRTAMTMTKEGKTQTTVGMPIYPSQETGLTLVCLRCGHSWLRRSLAKIPGRCPRCCSFCWNRTRQRQEQKVRLATRQQAETLTRAQGLQVASDVIGQLRGYRKNPEYLTIQRDLNFICEVLQRVSEGETNEVTKSLVC
jgi:hypothetical protein